MGKFSFLKRGERFYIDGEPFTKTGDLTYDDMAGIERYIGPLEDAKINPESPAVKEGKGPMIDSRTYITDPATRVQTKNPNFGKKIKQPKPPKKAKKNKE